MKFHVKFTYGSKNREQVLKLLHQGALKSEATVKAERVWIAMGGFSQSRAKDRNGQRFVAAMG